MIKVMSSFLKTSTSEYIFALLALLGSFIIAWTCLDQLEDARLLVILALIYYVEKFWSELQRYRSDYASKVSFLRAAQMLIGAAMLCALDSMATPALYKLPTSDFMNEYLSFMKEPLGRTLVYWLVSEVMSGVLLIKIGRRYLQFRALPTVNDERLVCYCVFMDRASSSEKILVHEIAAEELDLANGREVNIYIPEDNYMPVSTRTRKTKARQSK